MTTKLKTQEKKKLSDVDENISRLFEIKKRLGKGAYGIVWKALDKRTNETFAVKKIFDAFRDETDAQRTFREICFLQSFKTHPNVINLLTVYRASNNLDIYLVFEYMESDLHNIIKKGSILKDVHKRFVMYQLLNAIRYIHSGNVIHRDLKPSNILIDSKCRCKLADFGLARSLANLPLRDAPGTSDYNLQPLLTDYVATRWYRAPEILVASKRYTKGIDMWSLGCILAEMIRSKPLFQGTSTINQIEKIISALPDFTEQDVNAVGASFGSVLLSKEASTEKKTCLDDLIPDAPKDALDMIKSLLLLDPLSRLTANQAINHPYVERFRHSVSEVELDKDILPPFRDDVRLTVSEYRAKLYEVAQYAGERNQSSTGKRYITPSRRTITMAPPPKPRETSKYLERTVNENPLINKRGSRICVNRVVQMDNTMVHEQTRKTTHIATKQKPISPTTRMKQFEISNKAPNRNRYNNIDMRGGGGTAIAQNPSPSNEKNIQQNNIPKSKTLPAKRQEYLNIDKRHSIDGGYGSMPADTGSSEKTPRTIQPKLHSSSSITKANGCSSEYISPSVQQVHRNEKPKPPPPSQQAARPERNPSLIHRSSSVILGKAPRHIPDSLKENDIVNYCYDARIRRIELAVAGFKDDVKQYANEKKHRPPTPTRSVPTLHSNFKQPQTRYPQVRSKYTGGHVAAAQSYSSSSKMPSAATQQMVPAEGPIISNSNATKVKHNMIGQFPSFPRDRTDFSMMNHHTGGSGDHIGRNCAVTLNQEKTIDHRYKYNSKMQHHHMQQQQKQQQQQKNHLYPPHQHAQPSRNRIPSKVI